MLEGRFTVPADKPTVWINLNDPAVLKACIRGCQTLEKTSDIHFVATAKMRIGPLSASIKGRIDLENVDAPNGCRILAEGGGTLAGFAKGAADIVLTTVPGGTVVSYTVEANVGGRLAQLGGRLIGGVATRMADQFFTAFSAELAARAVAAAE